MSKPYQHHDEYHDIGKAEPKPKAPNPQQMVSRFFQVSVNPNTIHPYSAPRTRAQKQAENKLRRKQQKLVKL